MSSDTKIFRDIFGSFFCDDIYLSSGVKSIERLEV